MKKGSSPSNGTEIKLPWLWLKFLASLALTSKSVFLTLQYLAEKQKQKRLTQLPLVIRQITPRNDAICSLMTAVLQRSLRPVLFDGRKTSSKARQKNDYTSTKHLNHNFFHREHIIVNIDSDHETHLHCDSIPFRSNGIQVMVLDWFLPDTYMKPKHPKHSLEKAGILPPLRHPIILLLNLESNPNRQRNISNMIKESMIHTCIKNQWIAVQVTLQQIVNMDPASNVTANQNHRWARSQPEQLQSTKVEMTENSSSGANILRYEHIHSNLLIQIYPL